MEARCRNGFGPIVPEALDFDIFAGGHGALWRRKQDVTANRVFFEEPVASVSAETAQGKSLEELQKSLLFEKYKAEWNGYKLRGAQRQSTRCIEICKCTSEDLRND